MIRPLVITEGNKQKKAGPFLVPAFTVLQSGVDLFLKLLP
jgi:hypothetical protein